jgi:hypothetical protein
LHNDGVDVNGGPYAGESPHQLHIDMAPVMVPPVLAAEADYIYLVLAVHLACLYRLAVLLFGNAGSPIAVLEPVFNQLSIHQQLFPDTSNDIAASQMLFTAFC